MHYVIDHDAYGPDAVKFDSLEEAQAALRDCGDDFADITLEIRARDIHNERGEIVGRVEGE